jgi:hypothetical protein
MITHFLRKVLPDATSRESAMAPPDSPKESKVDAKDLGTPTPKSTEHSFEFPFTASAKSQAFVQTSKYPASNNNDETMTMPRTITNPPMTTYVLSARGISAR